MNLIDVPLNVTDTPLGEFLNTAHALLGIGYWALGGAIGIAVIGFLIGWYYRRENVVLLKKINRQNEEILSLLKKRRK